MGSFDIVRFAREWPAQRIRWERFAAWEREQLALAPPEFASALSWLAHAWDLALRYDPEWGSIERQLERCRDQAAVHRRLSSARSRR